LWRVARLRAPHLTRAALSSPVSASRRLPDPRLMSTHTETLETTAAPDTTVDAAGLFGIKTKMRVPAFKTANEHVPELDTAYRFDRDTTLAILAGFAFNRRVMIQGYHGTGKSTHIEQVAARLNWPCIRI